jgi:hypothetical protein
VTSTSVLPWSSLTLIAAETRKMADDHLSVWLRGSRGLLGLAYLTLIPVP